MDKETSITLLCSSLCVVWAWWSDEGRECRRVEDQVRGLEEESCQQRMDENQYTVHFYHALAFLGKYSWYISVSILEGDKQNLWVGVIEEKKILRVKRQHTGRQSEPRDQAGSQKSTIQLSQGPHQNWVTFGLNWRNIAPWMRCSDSVFDSFFSWKIFWKSTGVDNETNAGWRPLSGSNFRVLVRVVT